jgi:hypothetical protein
MILTITLMALLAIIAFAILPIPKIPPSFYTTVAILGLRTVCALISISWQFFDFMHGVGTMIFDLHSIVCRDVTSVMSRYNKMNSRDSAIIYTIIALFFGVMPSFFRAVVALYTCFIISAVRVHFSGIAHAKRYVYEYANPKTNKRRNWKVLRAAYPEIFRSAYLNHTLNHRFDIGEYEKFVFQAGPGDWFDPINRFFREGSLDIADMLKTIPALSGGIKNFLVKLPGTYTTLDKIVEQETGLRLHNYVLLAVCAAYIKRNGGWDANAPKVILARAYVGYCAAHLAMSFCRGADLSTFTVFLFTVCAQGIARDYHGRGTESLDRTEFEFMSGRLYDEMASFAKTDVFWIIKCVLRLAFALGAIYFGIRSGKSWETVVGSSGFATNIKSIAGLRGQAIINECMSMYDRLYTSYTTGSLSAFFDIDDSDSELYWRYKWFMDADITKLDSGIPNMAGDGMFHYHEFLKFGDDLRRDIRERANIELKQLSARSAWKNKATQVDARHTEVSHKLDSLGMHAAPYAVLVAGKSGVGKSLLTSIFRKACCTALNLPTDNTYTYIVNDLMKHWDGFCNHMHTLLWDDASAVKLESGDPLFLGSWLNVIGNNPYVPAAADLANKGRFRANFKLAFVTSNTVDLQAGMVMNAPEAVMRRFRTVIIPSLREGSVGPNGGIRDLVHDDPRNTAEMDHWTFRIMRPSLHGNAVRRDQYHMSNGETGSIVYNGIVYNVLRDGCNLVEVCKFLHDDAVVHFTGQDKVLKAADGVKDGIFDPDTGILTFQSGNLGRRVTNNAVLACLAVLAVNFPYDQAAAFIFNFITGISFKWMLSFVLFTGAFWFDVSSRINFDTYVSMVYRVYWYQTMIVRFVRFFCVTTVPSFFTELRMGRWIVFGTRLHSIETLASLAMRISSLHALDFRGHVIRLLTPRNIAVLGSFAAILMCLKYTTEWLFQAGGDHFDTAPKAVWNSHNAPRDYSSASQSVADPAAVVNKVARNVRWFILEKEGVKPLAGVFVELCVVGSFNLCVTNYHYYDTIGKGKSIMRIPYSGIAGEKGGFISSTCQIEVDEADTKRTYVMPGRDLLFFVYQSKHSPDISKYVAGPNHRSSAKSPMYMISRRNNDADPVISVSPHSAYTESSFSCKKALDRGGGVTSFPCIGQFRGNFDKGSTPGDCGSPYLQTDGNAISIVGIHAAFDPSSGVSVAVALNTADIDAAKVHFLSPPEFASGNVGAAAWESLKAFDHDCGMFPPAPRPVVNRLSDRSVFRQHNNPDDDITGTIDVVGSINASSVPPKTKVRHNPHASVLTNGTGFPGGGKVPPSQLKGDRLYRAKRYFIKNIAAIRDTFSPSEVANAVVLYIVDWTAKLYYSDTSEVRPLSVDESINGVKIGHLAKYMPAIDLSTSGGFGNEGPKRNFVVCNEPGKIRFADPIMRQVDSIDNAIRSGNRPNPEDVMFNSHFKDEPISPEKENMAKLRVINAGPLGFLIAFRKYILPIIAYIASNRLAFESCPSTVVQSYEWTLLRYSFTGEHIGEEANRMYIDGDYKGWDASLQKCLVMCFFRVAYHIAKQSGNYTEVDLRAIAGLSLIVCESYINFFGDVIMMSCFQPSGQPATAQTNGVINSVLFRYVWIKVGLDPLKFRHNVRILVYGDDNVGSVTHDYASVFNKRVVAEVLEPHGIYYTNADKTANITDFTPLANIDFLKRKWVWSEELDAYLAPLSVSTLGNMCSIYRSGGIKNSDFDQIVSTLRSLCEESFFHGPLVHDKVVTTVRSVIQSINPLYDFVVKTYREKVDDFTQDSVHFRKEGDRILTALSH